MNKTKDIVTSAELAVINAAVHNIENYDVSTGGKAAKYPNNEQGLQAFKADCIAYFRSLAQINTGLEVDDQKPVKATIEGLVTSLGMTRQNLSKVYYQRGGEWKDLIDYVKECICSCKWQAAASGKTPPVLALFDFTNNHNYLSTSEFKKVPEIPDKHYTDAVVYPDLSEYVKNNKISPTYEYPRLG